MEINPDVVRDFIGTRPQKSHVTESPIDMAMRAYIGDSVPNYTPTPHSNVYSRNRMIPGNVEEYRRHLGKSGVVPMLRDTSAMNESRARNQTGWELTKNAATQFILGEIVGGSLQTLGAFTNVEGLAKKVAGSETAWNQSLLEKWGANLQKYTREELAPIHMTKKAQAGFALGDRTWWASMTPTLASAISVMLPSFAVMKMLSTTGKALTSALTAGKGLSAASKTAKAGRFGEAFTGALLSRHADSSREAFQTFTEQTEYFRDTLNFSDGEARRLAGKAASRAYKLSYANLITDIPTWFLALKIPAKLNPNVAKRVGIGMLDKKHLGNLSPKFAEQAAKSAAKDAAQFQLKGIVKDMAKMGLYEGMEEVNIDFFQKEGIRHIEKQIGLLSPEELTTDVLSRYYNASIGDRHAWDSFFWGAAGGILMGGTMRVVNAQQAKKNKAREELAAEKILGKIDLTRANLEKLSAAYESESMLDYESAMINFATDLASNAFSDNTFEIFTEMLENASNLTSEEALAENLGKNTPEVAKSLLKIMQEAEVIFESNRKKTFTKSKYNPYFQDEISKRELIINQYQKKINETTPEIKRLQAERARLISDAESTPHRAQVETFLAVEDRRVTSQKLIKKAEEELKALNRIKDTVGVRLNSEKVTPTRRLENLDNITQLELNIRSVESEIKQHKKDLANYTEQSKQLKGQLETEAIDLANKISESYNADELATHRANVQYSEGAIVKAESQIKKFTDPEEQAETITALDKLSELLDKKNQKDFIDKLNSITDEKELQELKKEYDKEAWPEIDKRIKEVKEFNKQQKAKKKTVESDPATAEEVDTETSPQPKPKVEQEKKQPDVQEQAEEQTEEQAEEQVEEQVEEEEGGEIIKEAKAFTDTYGLTSLQTAIDILFEFDADGKIIIKPVDFSNVNTKDEAINLARTYYRLFHNVKFYMEQLQDARQKSNSSNNPVSNNAYNLLQKQIGEMQGAIIGLLETKLTSETLQDQQLVEEYNSAAREVMDAINKRKKLAELAKIRSGSGLASNLEVQFNNLLESIENFNREALRSKEDPRTQASTEMEQESTEFDPMATSEAVQQFKEDLVTILDTISFDWDTDITFEKVMEMVYLAAPDSIQANYKFVAALFRYLQGAEILAKDTITITSPKGKQYKFDTKNIKEFSPDQIDSWVERYKTGNAAILDPSQSARKEGMYTYLHDLQEINENTLTEEQEQIFRQIIEGLEEGSIITYETDILHKDTRYTTPEQQEARNKDTNKVPIAIKINGIRIGFVQEGTFIHKAVEYIDSNGEYSPFTNHLTSFAVDILVNNKEKLFSLYNKAASHVYNKSNATISQKDLVALVGEEVASVLRRMANNNKDINTEIQFQSLHHVLAPMFYNIKGEQLLTLNKQNVARKYKNQQIRFQEDYENIRAIRSNIAKGSIQGTVTSISNPPYVRTDSRTPITAIKPINYNGKTEIQFAVRKVDDYGGSAVYYGETGERVEYANNPNEVSKHDEHIYVIVEPRKGVRQVMRVDPSRIYDSDPTIQKKIVSLIKEQIKLIGQDPTNMGEAKKLFKLLLTYNEAPKKDTIQKGQRGKLFFRATDFEGEAAAVQLTSYSPNGKFTYYKIWFDKNSGEFKFQTSTEIDSSGFLTNKSKVGTLTDSQLNNVLAGARRGVNIENATTRYGEGRPLLKKDKNTNVEDTFIDPITGKETTYKQFLISSEAVMSNIGAIFNKQGEVVSNHAPSAPGAGPLTIFTKPNFEEVSESDLKVDYKELEGKTVEEIFELFPNIEQFNFILEELKRLNINVKFAVDTKTKDQRHATAESNIKEGESEVTIILFERFTTSQTDQGLTLVHELLHPIYNKKYSLLDDVSRAAVDKDLATFVDSLRRFIDPKDSTLTTRQKKLLSKYIEETQTDIRETVNYAFAHKEIAYILNQITVDSKAETPQTFWGKLLEAILNVIGVAEGNKLGELSQILSQHLEGTPAQQVVTPTVPTTPKVASQTVNLTSTQQYNVSIVDGQYRVVNSKFPNRSLKVEGKIYNAVMAKVDLDSLIEHDLFTQEGRPIGEERNAAPPVDDKTPPKPDTPSTGRRGFNRDAGRPLKPKQNSIEFRDVNNMIIC